MGICRRQFGACLLGGAARVALGAVPRPKLLVIVLLEQFRPDYLELVRGQLSPGGFRKLFEKGAVYHNCLHEASTFASSTLATIATGAWPAQHGIVADLWYERSIKQAIPPTDEDLLATTFAAQVAADPNARVTVIGLDRAPAAIFAGTPEARLFWLDDDAQFTTNVEIPGWLAPFNAQQTASARDVRWLAMNAKADAPPLRTLTYDPARPRDFLALYRGSPFSQSAQFDLAADLIRLESIGKNGGLEVLCILAGSMAQLGHETGARGPLMQQMTLQLDKRLESLLALLAKSLGETGFNLVLAGAHGAPPDPPPDARERMAVSGDQLAAAIDRALQADGNGRVEKYIYPFLYLDTNGFRDPEPIREAAARAAMKHPAVAGYYTAGGASSIHGDWARRYRNSFHPARSGDVMLSYRPEYVESFLPGRGVSYGSLYNYDARVPLCFYGPQFRPGQFEQMVTAADIAPTLARACGVGPPSSSTGRVLGEALAE
jgi:hypothetical protein